MAKRAAARHIPTYFLYGEPMRRVTGPLLHVETIEARSSKHHWKIDPHLHPVLHQMVLVLKGTGVVLAESARTQFRPPALMLMPAGSVHGFEFEPGTTGYVVSLSDQLQQDIVRLEPESQVLFAAPQVLEFGRGTLRSMDLLQAIRRLSQEGSRSLPGHELALRGWLDVLLACTLRLARQRLNPADPVTGRRRQLVVRFNELIERRFRKSEPLSAYALALSVSESRLRNACFAVTGQTPVQLLHARLLLEAKRQLLYTDQPVRRIAYGLGFDDAAYFSRFFSRQTALSPRAFRLRGANLIASPAD